VQRRGLTGTNAPIRAWLSQHEAQLVAEPGGYMARAALGALAISQPPGSADRLTREKRERTRAPLHEDAASRVAEVYHQLLDCLDEGSVEAIACKPASSAPTSDCSFGVKASTSFSGMCIVQMLPMSVTPVRESIST